MLVDFKADCFSSAESRSTKQGTEHLLESLGRLENPSDDFASEVRRVLFALVHDRHVDEFVDPLTKEPSYEMEFKNILFATDFGKNAEREAEYAFSLAQEHRSRLTLLHVFPHPEAYGKEALSDMEHNFYAQLRELVPVATEMHCKVEVRVVFGEPTKQALRITKETNAELIVMGAKARKSLAGNVPHTKAYRVVCEAHCPVLTIRS